MFGDIVAALVMRTFATLPQAIRRRRPSSFCTILVTRSVESSLASAWTLSCKALSTSAINVPRTSWLSSNSHGSTLTTSRRSWSFSLSSISLSNVDFPPPQPLWIPIVSGSSPPASRTRTTASTTPPNPRRSSVVGLSSKSGAG